jgi:hypothetical protein
MPSNIAPRALEKNSGYALYSLLNEDTCLSVLSLALYVCLTSYLALHLSILSVCLYVHLSVSLSICPSFCLPVPIILIDLSSISMCFQLSLCLSVYVCVALISDVLV